MKIETKRLLLRPFTAADGEDLYSYLSDPEVVRFEPYDVFTKADAEKEAARRAGDPNFFAVVLKKPGMSSAICILRRASMKNMNSAMF